MAVKRARKRASGAPPAHPAAPAQASERERLDKWLWRARFFKTRGAAAAAVEAGRIRVDGKRVSKPAHGVKIGDVLVFAVVGRVRVVEVLAFGARRGPAAEAAALYRDGTADPAPATKPVEAPLRARKT
ncbi:MAG: S4 domain-containing protein [Pseudomonadota bacterium]